MRLDLYLKQIGVLKRRSLSKETIEKNRVRVNDQLTKPSYEVKPKTSSTFILKTTRLKFVF